MIAILLTGKLVDDFDKFLKTCLDLVQFNIHILHLKKKVKLSRRVKTL